VRKKERKKKKKKRLPETHRDKEREKTLVTEHLLSLKQPNGW
jgi:hypothetical protein